jgi:hypothetical protein
MVWENYLKEQHCFFKVIDKTPAFVAPLDMPAAKVELKQPDQNIFLDNSVYISFPTAIQQAG